VLGAQCVHLLKYADARTWKWFRDYHDRLEWQLREHAECWPHQRRIDMVGSVKPSKILSVAPIFNSDLPSVSIEVRCSLCDEVDTLVVNLNHQAGDLSWLRRDDFYFVCGRHRKFNSN
jgi:hypothetical protein